MNCGLIDRNMLKRVRGGMLLREGRGSSFHPGKGDNAEHRQQIMAIPDSYPILKIFKEISQSGYGSPKCEGRKQGRKLIGEASQFPS